MTDSPNTIARRVGSTEFPYSSADILATESAFTDPVQELLLAVFKAAIVDEFEDAFHVASGETPLAGKSVVADTWSGLLTPAVMKQRKGVFPLLAVGWDGKAEWAEHTIEIDRCTRKWVVNYVLGPLDVAQAQRLDKLPHKIAVLMQLVIRNRGHKAFQNGALLWGDPTVGRPAYISFDSHEAGQASFAGDADSPLYYAMTAQLTTGEDDFDLNSYEALTGATFTGALADPSGNLADFIEAETEHPGLEDNHDGTHHSDGIP